MTSWRLAMCGATLIGAAASAAAAPAKAVLRVYGDRQVVVLLPDPPVSDPSAVSQVRATVYRKGEMIPAALTPPPSGGALALALTDFKGAVGDLQMAFEYVQAGTLMSGLTSVGLEISTKIITIDPNCSNLALNFEAKEPSEYVVDRLKRLVEYVAAHKPTARVDPRTTKGTLSPGVKYEQLAPVNSQVPAWSACFELDGHIPFGNYDLSLEFPGDAPIELRPMVLKTDLKNTSHAAAPLSIDPNDPAKRGLEQNLDAGLQFASSVKTNNGESTRTNTGTLDFRIAPFLNFSPTPAAGSKTFFFFTPVLVNARISTGDITTDTLSSNRIVIASESEWRHFVSVGTYPTYHRLMASVRSAADRDFDRAEWKGAFEWQPVFGPLTRPLAWREELEDNAVDPNPQREMKRIPGNGVGWQLLPRLGFEAGHTWRNERPELSVERTDNVYRLFLGGTVAVDLSRYVAVSVEDTLYVRGEVDSDQARNYFKAKAELPLLGFTSSMAQSIFFSYERGALPPYSTPDVDALKLGYRVQWDGWFDQIR